MNDLKIHAQRQSLWLSCLGKIFFPKPRWPIRSLRSKIEMDFGLPPGVPTLGSGSHRLLVPLHQLQDVQVTHVKPNFFNTEDTEITENSSGLGRAQRYNVAARRTSPGRMSPAPQGSHPCTLSVSMVPNRFQAGCELIRCRSKTCGSRDKSQEGIHPPITQMTQIVRIGRARSNRRLRRRASPLVKGVALAVGRNCQRTTRRALGATDTLVCRPPFGVLSCILCSRRASGCEIETRPPVEAAEDC